MRRTSPLSRESRDLIQTIALEVVSGPDAGHKAQGQGELLSVGTAPGNDVVLSDQTVSRYHLELARSPDGIVVVDLGSTNGTFAGSIRVERAVVPAGTTLTLGHGSIRVSDGVETAVEVLEDDRLHELLGRTPKMRRMMAQVARVALTSVPVLLLGESGTGKELVARALHESSPRAGGPFVTVDCAALTPALVASELFGHERGAFTGAERHHIGAFERASGGTLFLDELGELPADLQPQLLGALERRRFRRLGGSSEVEIDVRLVTATNRDLRAEVNAGLFRMDLYFRVAVAVFRLPALRERRGDIPLLVEHFLRQAGHDGPIESAVPAARMDELCAHHWPGNVRELKNWVEATLALGEPSDLFTVSEPDISGTARARLLALPYREARETVLGEFELEYCRRLLEVSQGNVARAARMARMDRSYLIKMLQKHGLKLARSSAPEEDQP